MLVPMSASQFSRKYLDRKRSGHFWEGFQFIPAIIVIVKRSRVHDTKELNEKSMPEPARLQITSVVLVFVLGPLW